MPLVLQNISTKRSAVREYKARISIVGSSKAGKSSILYHFLKDKKILSKVAKTQHADYFTEPVQVDRTTNVRFDIQDWNAPAEKHLQVRSQHKRTQAFIIVVDISDDESFECAKKMLERAQEVYKDKLVMLVGTKYDTLKSKGDKR
mmetsp:Transcript_11672/g.10148  ORF Transcript_11672/g.10148 Transcript_11672/m.10148 type:complete len:146 (+) Transcript_11672:83-520(+)